MGFLLELLVELLGEALLHVVLEFVLELVLVGAVDAVLRFVGRVRKFHPAMPIPIAVVVFLCIGAGFGGLTLLALPEHVLATRTGGIVALVLTPPLVGLLLALAGRRRERKDRPRTQLEFFLAGTAMALGISLVRFLAAGHW